MQSSLRQQLLKDGRNRVALQVDVDASDFGAAQVWPVSLFQVTASRVVLNLRSLLQTIQVERFRSLSFAINFGRLIPAAPATSVSFGPYYLVTSFGELITLGSSPGTQDTATANTGTIYDGDRLSGVLDILQDDNDFTIYKVPDVGSSTSSVGPPPTYLPTNFLMRLVFSTEERAPWVLRSQANGLG